MGRGGGGGAAPAVVTPAATPAADFVPGPHAASLLMAHCLQKSSQVGSVLGVAACGVAAARGHARGAALTVERAATLLATSLAGGTVALGAASAAKIATLDEEGIADRVYRLHYHAGQNRTDRLANAGGLLAAGVAALLLPAVSGRVQTVNGLAGYAAGTAAGIAAHLASPPREKKPA